MLASASRSAWRWSRDMASCARGMAPDRQTINRAAQRRYIAASSSGKSRRPTAGGAWPSADLLNTSGWGPRTSVAGRRYIRWGGASSESASRIGESAVGGSAVGVAAHSVRVSGCAKRLVEKHLSRSSSQGTWRQLQRHEDFVWNVEFAGKSEARRAAESEARVILRVADHEQRFDALLPAAHGPSRTRADPMPACCRAGHRHRRQPHRTHLACARQPNRRKHAVTDDGAVLLGDEGDDVRLSAQRVDDPGFRGGFECGAVQGVDVWDVCGLFRWYLHG